MTGMTSAFIAVDWGTTNRRAYRLDAQGKCEKHAADEMGVRSVEPGAYAEAAAELRSALGDAPMLLAGMVGSTRGWANVPYVATPADLDTLARAVHRVDARTFIVPGVSRCAADRVDVMRGEEVQALGALTLDGAAANGTIVHPGTHAKWITMAGGRIVDFRTSMTGELFALLREHSILAPQLHAAVVPGPAFEAGVAKALSGVPMLDALFEVRSAGLFERLTDADAASHVSGLLIGYDVDAHCKAATDPVVVGDPALCRLYVSALGQVGRAARSIDGADAFIAGMRGIYERMAT